MRILHASKSGKFTVTDIQIFTDDLPIYQVININILMENISPGVPYR